MDYPEGVFLGLEPDYSDINTAKYVILPIPYDGTACYQKGTADGPAAIIEASPQMEWFDEELKIELHLPGIATADPVEAAGTPQEEMTKIHAAAQKLSAPERFILALGGEHSITAPLVRAAIETHGPLAVLHVDAHADLRDSFDGTPHSHAAVMSRVLEMTGHICQVGVRSFSAEEYAAHGNRIDSRITPEQIRNSTDWLGSVIETLGGLDAKVYISIDIDGLDPAIAPGTGTPEPGGLLWHEICALIKRVCHDCRVVAADIVEVKPLPDSPVTEFLAARLAAKIIAHHQYAYGPV